MLRRLLWAKKFSFFIPLFLILPLGQFLILYSLRFDSWAMLWISGVLMGLAANISLLFYTISQEKKVAVQEELKKIQHLRTLESVHYSAVENSRKQMAEIRKDFIDRLEAVSILVSKGSGELAREMMAGFADKISLTREAPYCTIPVVNAVLLEKESVCKAAGITLSVNLYIPASLTVSSVHLCSIFGNILDNAIQACKKVQSMDRVEPVIYLSSKVVGDYLFIKAANPSDKPELRPTHRHGYGLRILRDLAKQYSGDFQSGYRDGIFTVVMSLIASDADEGEQ